MTTLEAFNRIEDALSALGLRDRWGDPIEGIMASGIVAHSIGQDWDSTVDAFEHGQITADEYCLRILSLIRFFDRMRFSARVDARLAALKLDQIELDLLPTSLVAGNGNH